MIWARDRLKPDRVLGPPFSPWSGTLCESSMSAYNQEAR